MAFRFSPIYLLRYLLKREATQFFTSIAIRNLALGMVLIFEPIFLYYYFDHSLSLTFLFFGTIHVLFGLLAVFGGKIMSRIGLKHSIFFSHFFFLGYYLCLFFLPSLPLLIPLGILMRALGMTLFWPAFHVDFLRFSERGYQGREVGKINIAFLIPTIISPLIGGWILSYFSYPVLFTTILAVLFTSTIPMFLSRETHILYSNSYQSAWERISKKSNQRINIGILTNSLEWGINSYCWPLFMAILAIGYGTMGGITTFALVMAVFLTLYIARISDRIINRIRLLNLGAILTSLAWLIKYFVITPFTAFLAHTIYRICQTTASIPYQALLYEKASLKGPEVDEFTVYQETVSNVSLGLFFFVLALIFFIIPQVNLAFIFASIISLGMTFMGLPPKFFRNLKRMVSFPKNKPST